jgi:hypothetical protein
MMMETVIYTRECVSNREMGTGRLGRIQFMRG